MRKTILIFSFFILLLFTTKVFAVSVADFANEIDGHFNQIKISLENYKKTGNETYLHEAEKSNDIAYGKTIALILYFAKYYDAKNNEKIWGLAYFLLNKVADNLDSIQESYRYEGKEKEVERLKQDLMIFSNLNLPSAENYFVENTAVKEVAAAQKDVYVKGYFKKDGTYIKPHFRTKANRTKLDNYSTRGNINPYTGKKGTKDPFK